MTDAIGSGGWHILDATSEKIPSVSCCSDIGVTGDVSHPADSGCGTTNLIVSVALYCCLPPMVGLFSWGGGHDNRTSYSTGRGWGSGCLLRNSFNDTDAVPTRLRFRCFFFVCDLWKT